MPFVPFKKGGGKAAPTSGKLPTTTKKGAKKPNPFAVKKTRRSPF